MLNGSSSTWKKVISEVPQGSVLCPLLFLIYVNDLPDRIKDISDCTWNMRYLKGDTDKLEKVQKQATRLVSGYKKLPYDERLWRLGLTTLEQRVRVIHHWNKLPDNVLNVSTVNTFKNHLDRELGINSSRWPRPTTTSRSTSTSTNMAAGNCHAKFSWGSFPYLGEWEVAASQEDPLYITWSLYANVVESRVAHTPKISLSHWGVWPPVMKIRRFA